MANTLRAPQQGISRQEFIVNDLTGGMVSQAASYNIDTKYLVDSQNMRLIQGMWQKRKGFSLIGSFTGIGDETHTNKGMFVYNNQGNLHLLAIYGNVLYDTYQVTQDNGGKIVTASLPEAARYRFSVFGNRAYIANGEVEISQYDGNAVKSIHSPIGSLITRYDNRLVLSGIKGDGMTIYYSEDGQPKDWNPLNFITLDGGNNEFITALIPVQGKLFIFTNLSIFSLVGSFDNFAVTKEVNGVGTIRQETVQLFGNVMYFIADTGKLYQFDGGSFPVEISSPIRDYLTSKFHYTDFQNACLTHFEDEIWFTLDNSIEPRERVTLVYYPDWQAWTKFAGIPSASYVYVNKALLFTGVHNQGSIYQYGTNYEDQGTAIDAFVKTTKWTFDGVENIKRFRNLFVRGALQGGAGNGFDIDFYVDDSKTATVHVTSDIATPTEFWGGSNEWGSLFWGYAADTALTRFGQTNWLDFEWGSSTPKLQPKWGTSVWDIFKWGDNKQGDLTDDVGIINYKIYLSQYNIISGKTLQLVFRDNTPSHGFRLENLTLELTFKKVR